METATIEREQTTVNIFDKAVCLSVSLHRLGVRRKVKLAELKPGVEVDEDAIGVSKELLDCPEYDAIRQADGELRRYLEKRTSGPALFRSGVYMLSYKMLDEVDRELETRLKERREKLVPAFVAVYEKAREDAKKTLGDLYHAEDYPPVEAVGGAFEATTRYFEMGDATRLESIRADIFQREQAKAAAQWDAILAASQDVLLQEFSGLVDHLVERLEPQDGGKKKRFNATLVENLDEFLRNYNARAISTNAELTAAVEAARDVLKGVTPASLRDSRFTRQKVAETFAAIKGSIDRLVETAPSRRFEFGD
jgi:DNA-binding transcriptional regulator YbjK